MNLLSLKWSGKWDDDIIDRMISYDVLVWKYHCENYGTARCNVALDSRWNALYHKQGENSSTRSCSSS